MTDTQTKLRHPKGLYVLFFSEMWERFGYYLMLGILLLYLKDPQGGFGYSNAKASDIVGTYLGLVYLTPFLGGLIADRILGYRRAVILGGLLMAGGYLGLAIPTPSAFWISVLLIAVGNGFFKPNISTLLGNLYTEEKKALKDSGYNIFYMGINLGAFICNFVAAYMRNAYGWGYAFGAAGVGMLIGVIWLLAGNKYIKHADVRKPANAGDMPVSTVLYIVFIPMLVAGAIGWFIPGNIFGSDSTDAFIIACIPVISYYINLMMRSNKEDKSRIAALLSIFAVVIVFWAIFKQNSSALTNYAETYTDREIASSVVPLVKPLGMVQEAQAGDAYTSNLQAGGQPADGESLKLISTEIFQSVNPFFIILLTPLVVGLFGWLRSRNAEPSTPAKIGYGLLITALSTSIMALAVYNTDLLHEKSSAWWLIASYGVITVGELFLSPIGLSLVSKVAPPRLTSLMMGGWFLATSIGNKLSGVLASMWDIYDNKANFFWVNFIACSLAGMAIFAMLKWLKSIINQHH